MDTSKRGYIPIQERSKLNKTQGASKPEEVKRMQNVPYASLVGSIMYAVCSWFMVEILKLNFKLVAIAMQDLRPIEMILNLNVFILNRGAVDWKSSKQSTTTMSAIEVEYISASEVAMKAVWIRMFISGLGIVPTINEPIKMFYDNSAALIIANELGV
ncbi:hypothetical protein Tco_0635483 [Tanacetum coccineum]